jgi:uncharacterized membrane protein
MFNLTPLEVAITFLGTLCGLALVWLIKGSFKKGLTQGDIHVAITMLIALPLATFLRSYFMINPNSWAAFWIIPAITAFVSTILPLFINRVPTKSHK